MNFAMLRNEIIALEKWCQHLKLSISCLESSIRQTYFVDHTEKDEKEQLGPEEVDLSAVDDLIAQARKARTNAEQGKTRPSTKLKSSKTAEQSKGKDVAAVQAQRKPKVEPSEKGAVKHLYSKSSTIKAKSAASSSVMTSSVLHRPKIHRTTKSGQTTRPLLSKESDRKDQYLNKISSDISSKLVLNDEEPATKTDISKRHPQFSQRQPSAKISKEEQPYKLEERAMQTVCKEPTNVVQINPVLVDAWSKVANLHRKFGRLRQEERSASILAKESFVRNLESRFDNLNDINSELENDTELFLTLVRDGKCTQKEVLNITMQVKELRKHVSDIITKTKHDEGSIIKKVLNNLHGEVVCSNYKELQSLINLILNYHLLTFKLGIQHSLKDVTKEVLVSPAVPESMKMQMYRLIYSILCEDCRSFPTMIKDFETEHFDCSD